jgi:hypothetical protein
MEERDHAGLPELERERKRAEQLEKRAAEAEKKARRPSAALERAQSARRVDRRSKAGFDDPTTRPAPRSSTSTTSRTPTRPSGPSSGSRKPSLAPVQGRGPQTSRPRSSLDGGRTAGKDEEGWRHRPRSRRPRWLPTASRLPEERRLAAAAVPGSRRSPRRKTGVAAGPLLPKTELRRAIMANAIPLLEGTDASGGFLVPTARPASSSSVASTASPRSPACPACASVASTASARS